MSNFSELLKHDSLMVLECKNLKAIKGGCCIRPDDDDFEEEDDD